MRPTVDYANRTLEELLTPDENGWTPLHWVAWKGCLNQIPAEIRARIPADETGWLRPDNDGWTPLHRAAWKGCLEQIPAEILTRIPVNETGWLRPDKNGRTSMYWATRQNGLYEILTFEIWRGRLIELATLWKHVPDEYKEQYREQYRDLQYRIIHTSLSTSKAATGKGARR